MHHVALLEYAQLRQGVDIPADWRGSLDEKRAKELFARFGLRCVREV